MSNTRWGRRISLQQFERTPQIVLTLTGRDPVANDKVLEDKGVRRTVVLRTSHFLMVPRLLKQNPDLIATVPRELGNVFARLEIVRMLEPPLDLPTFAINQYWHPLSHHEPGIVWLRELIKLSFQTYPNICSGSRT